MGVLRWNVRIHKWVDLIVVLIPENHWVENWASPAFDRRGESDEEIEI